MSLFIKEINNCSRQIIIFLLMATWGIAMAVGVLLGPIGLDLVMPLNESRTRYIVYVTVLFTDNPKHVDMVALHMTVVFIFTLIGLSCTEATLSVMCSYICAIFRISSYRMGKSISNLSNYNLQSQSMDVDESYTILHQGVDIHTKAIELINVAETDMKVPYLVAILLVILSFAVSLHRLFKATTTSMDILEFLVSSLFVGSHLIFMFLNNYSGQRVVDTSVNIYKEVCDSTWYLIPVNGQKLLIMIILRSSIECALDLSGLFTPSFVGFSTMMSTSFSYFTLMYSVQDTN